MLEVRTKVGEVISDVEEKSKLAAGEGSVGIIGLIGRLIFQTRSKAHDLQVTGK
jgi:hypothetical protein